MKIIIQKKFNIRIIEEKDLSINMTISESESKFLFYNLDDSLLSCNFEDIEEITISDLDNYKSKLYNYEDFHKLIEYIEIDTIAIYIKLKN